MRKSILEGQSLPWGYGIAWMEWDKYAFVAYPIPLNIILAWGRNLYYWLTQWRKGYIDNIVEEALRKQMEQEYEYREYLRKNYYEYGYEKGVKTIKYYLFTNE